MNRPLEKLFDEYTRSLQVIQPEATDTFMCPLCMHLFNKEDASNGNLSLEHIPPKSIKAAIKTMTCINCNNTIGTKLQSYMVNYVQRKELEVGRVSKPIPARVQIQGMEFDTTIVASEGGKWRTESLTSKLPPNVKSIESTDTLIGKSATISLRRRDPRTIVDRAYLHSSYMLLFSLLGYPYIMQPFLANIRQQINKGQNVSPESRIVVPTSLKSKVPFLDPREKGFEISLIGTESDPQKSCFVLVIAGEIVLMPFISNHYEVIRSEFNLLLSDLANGNRKSFPFHINLLEIDPLCKYSMRYVFESGKQINELKYLRLSPLRND